MTFENTQHEELVENAQPIKGTFQDEHNDYFLLLNTRLKIVSYNQSASAFFNQLTEKNLQPGKRLSEYLTRLQLQPLKQMLEKAKEGLTSQEEILLTGNNNDISWIRFTVSPTFNNKNEIIGIACIGYNVQKEKVQEEKIKNQKSVLKHIAQMYSHQIRHPLTNIMAIIDLIKYEDFKMTKKYMGYLEIASKELDMAIRSVVLDSVKAG